MEANDTLGVCGQLDSRGIRMGGTIYVEDHPTLLCTKYISCGPHGYLIFSHCMSESY